MGFRLVDFPNKTNPMIGVDSYLFATYSVEVWKARYRWVLTKKDIQSRPESTMRSGSGNQNLHSPISFFVPSSKLTYPLVNIQKAIENGHRNSEFSHEK